MKKNQYWKNRQFDDLNKLYDRTEAEIAKQLELLYIDTAKHVKKEMEAFYDKLQALGKDKIIASDIYRYNRYNKLIAELNAEISEFEKDKIIILDKNLKDYAAECNKLIEKEEYVTAKVNKKAAEKVVNTVWASDGKNYSDRIWADKGKLLETLGKGLFRHAIIGSSTEQLARDIEKEFGVNFKVAMRLVRTEMVYIQSQLALDRYKESGIERYRYLTLRDDNVCDYCDSLNQQVFLIKDAEFGINVPPIHPNCRCLIAPVV